jgi:hypothetical protein
MSIDEGLVLVDKRGSDVAQIPHVVADYIEHLLHLGVVECSALTQVALDVGNRDCRETCDPKTIEARY